MRNLSFSNDLTIHSSLDKDVLSVFKPTEEKTLTIQQGMSVLEISDIVSEKIIAIVKEQFQATKDQFTSTGK
jgi:hypothetical protein